MLTGRAFRQRCALHVERKRGSVRREDLSSFHRFEAPESDEEVILARSALVSGHAGHARHSVRTAYRSRGGGPRKSRASTGLRALQGAGSPAADGARRMVVAVDTEDGVAPGEQQQRGTLERSSKAPA